MSELNFKEIEKAMAELVNKTQGQQREKQLNSVVRKRDQITKKKEDKIGQGRVATKRIIIGNKGLRANLASPRTSSVPVTAKSNPISDFRPPAPRPLVVEPVEETLVDEQEQVSPLDQIDQTVGDLSNQYLTKEVSKPYEPEFTTPEPGQEEVEEISDDELNDLDRSSEEGTDNLSEAPLSSEVEDQINQSPTQESPTNELDASHPTIQDNLPEAEELSQSLDDPTYDRGAVHRIYGQKMPTHSPVDSFAKDKVDQDQSKDLFKPDAKKQLKNKKHHSKHGFLFYFVIFLVLASLAVWGLAIYLYMMPQ